MSTPMKPFPKKTQNSLILTVAWITPQNIKSTLQEPQLESIKVSCITTDFAIQNGLLQMNLNLISLTGLRITKVKLRCHASLKISKKLDLVFCRKCGNTALIRLHAESTSADVQTVFESLPFLPKINPQDIIYN
jgi:rRNA maturation endonuclease Nob1